ncbi:MAG: YggS family pyridoxal phosphate-dependent enzyme, partial [Rhodospirillaceae bacterium]|nr:YggS family pyridoxal phosphate-dependent enzyme [Rhodospirillaceae bacterium]
MTLSDEPAGNPAENPDGNSVDVAANLALVQASIAGAAKAAGRDGGDAALVAVSKTQGTEAILPVIQAGQRLFGENRVQEAQGKWPDIKAANPDLRLHLIGPLQSNKVKDAVELFDVIETVDRPKLARALAREMAKQ